GVRRSVADDSAVLDGRRMGGLQREVRSPVDHLPAGRLDLTAETVGLGPVPRRAGCGALVGERQDLVGNACPWHPPRIPAEPDQSGGSGAWSWMLPTNWGGGGGPSTCRMARISPVWNQ